MTNPLKNPNIVRCFLLSSDSINEARIKLDLGIKFDIHSGFYMVLDKRGIIFQYEGKFHSITWKQYDTIRKTKAL